MSLILITGGTGYVGSAILETLRAKAQFEVRAAVRSTVCGNIPTGVDTVQVSSLASDTEWTEAVKDVDILVHAAARVHVMNDFAKNALAEYRRVNVEGTLNLARQAASSGVKRFIFISSIKVNGEGTELGVTYREDDVPAPVDPYAISKLEAEKGLQLLAQETGMEVVIIRPPLVYGAGVKANFQSMMRWVALGVPMPFGSVNNKRSFVALENLVDLIHTCLLHPNAANQVFLVADGEDLSTTDLLCRVGKAIGKPVRLFSVPVGLLYFFATLMGKKAIAQRLCDSLQIDITKAREVLGWTPPSSVDEGILRATEGVRG